MSRPRIEIDWTLVDKLCALQATAEEIAHCLGCSDDTLSRRCQEEFRMSFADYIDQKRDAGRLSLRRAQWKVAERGNVTMLIWLGKQWLGQRDKSSTEMSGPDGKPIELKSSKTDEQVEAEIRALLTAKPKAEEGNDPGPE